MNHTNPFVLSPTALDHVDAFDFITVLRFDFHQ